MQKKGIELGIRAPLETIQKAAAISENSNKIDYFFVPETHPKFIGVDAFHAMESLIGIVHKVCLGTGIVNVFARSEQATFTLADKIYRETNENFLLGLGTSTPYIIEKMYKIKFQKPLTKLVNYTIFLKKHYRGPIFWGAVGDKAIKLAANHADGLMFFLKTEEEIKRGIDILKKELNSIGKSLEDFEVISIRPTIIDESIDNAKKAARISLASYVTGNKFYADPLAKSGYQKEITEIREIFDAKGLSFAADKVSEKMVKEFVTLGNVNHCAKDFNEFSKRVNVGCVVAGFMSVHPEDDKNIKFLKDLEEFISRI